MAMLPFLLAAALASQPPAPAPPAVPTEEGSTVVAELEVVARPPGPAMWRVSRGGSEVLILGAVSPLPHTLQWDDRRVRRALDGARLLLAPPQAQAGVFELPGLAIKLLRMKSATPLEARTPPALYARVLAAARIAHADPKRYQGWRPAAAGALLLLDFQKAAGLSNAKPGSTVERLAKAARVPVRPLARIRAAPFMDVLARLDDAHQQQCLSAAVDEVVLEAGRAASTARAWAVGRLAEVRAQRSEAAWDRCILDAPTARALIDRGTADAVAAVEDALRRPGRTVAVVDLRFLDRRDGLLDRLRARGAEVTAPLL